jgi:hypothetical protein
MARKKHSPEQIVAILTKPTALGFRAEGVVVRPLSHPSLCVQTCVIMRTGDDSRLANEFARSFLCKYAPQCRALEQHSVASAEHVASEAIWPDLPK